jgi:hypothetical protein
MSENYQDCKLRNGGFFCDLEAAALKDFDTAKASSAPLGGSYLCMGKRDPRGVFILGKK